MVSAMILKLSTWLRFVPMWIRQLAIPAYRPEQHYMRGPGPACARATPRRPQKPSDRDGR
jgi:hypothetical protein